MLVENNVHHFNFAGICVFKHSASSRGASKIKKKCKDSWSGVKTFNNKRACQRRIQSNES